MLVGNAPNAQIKLRGLGILPEHATLEIVGDDVSTPLLTHQRSDRCYSCL